MANVIKHKRGSGSDPSASDLILGELAIRTDTGKLFTKMDSGAIAEIAGGGSDIAINTLSSSSATGGGSATFNGSAYRFTLSSPPSVSAAQLLVSVNGVIQKPVAGTGQPSEGFSVDGTDIILGDAPATGSDFFILTFRSLGVSEPAANSVTNAKIASNAAIAGTKISPNFGSQQIITTSSLNVGTINASSNSDQILNLNSSDNGAVYLAFKRSGGRKAYFGYGGTSNTISLANEISDGDLTIVGNDGGNNINMLAFDTSENGKATFSGKVTVNDDILPGTTATHNIGSNNIGGIGNGRFANAYFSSSVWILDSTGGLMLGNSFDTKFYHSGTNSFIDHSGTGALNFRSNNGFGFACSTSGGETAMQIVKNGGIKLYQNNSSNANSDLRLETTSGGIDISGSTDGVLNLDTTDGRGSFIRFKENGTVKGYVGCSEGLGLGDQDDISLRATDRVFIQTGGASETMRLGRSGSHAQVFMNCTETFSNAVFSIQTNGTCVIGTKATATNTQKHLSFRNPNGEVGQIVTGSNSTTYDTTSDYRLKENEVAISDGITRLKTLKPYRFNFKNTPSEILDGFYAHEVMTVVPQAVVGKKDEVDSNGDPKYQGIDHSMIVPLLVAALQEAIGRIEALEAK